MKFWKKNEKPDIEDAMAEQKQALVKLQLALRKHDAESVNDLIMDVLTGKKHAND